VYATPTKPEYAEVGTALVRHAAQRAQFPFFAIGGIDPGNVAGGASRRLRNGRLQLWHVPSRR